MSDSRTLGTVSSNSPTTIAALLMNGMRVVAKCPSSKPGRHVSGRPLNESKPMTGPVWWSRMTVSVRPECTPNSSAVPWDEPDAAFSINRETVLLHLKRAGVTRSPSLRKLNDDEVRQAASLYAQGISLRRTAEKFGVSERTMRRELIADGQIIRPRRGW